VKERKGAKENRIGCFLDRINKMGRIFESPFFILSILAILSKKTGFRFF
jgi:hypothetical protein